MRYMYSKRTHILHTQCFRPHGSKNEADGKRKLDCMNRYQNIYQYRSTLCTCMLYTCVNTFIHIPQSSQTVAAERFLCPQNCERSSATLLPPGPVLCLQGPEEIR